MLKLIFTSTSGKEGDIQIKCGHTRCRPTTSEYGYARTLLLVILKIEFFNIIEVL